MPKKTEIRNDSRTVGARKQANEDQGHFVLLSRPVCKSNVCSCFVWTEKEKPAKDGKIEPKEYGGTCKCPSLHVLQKGNILFHVFPIYIIAFPAKRNAKL